MFPKIYVSLYLFDTVNIRWALQRVWWGKSSLYFDVFCIRVQYMDLKTIMISYFAFSARTIIKISFYVVIISECLFLIWQYCISPIVWKRQLWVNRLAEELRLINPHWDGDRLYQGSGSKQIRGEKYLRVVIIQIICHWKLQHLADNWLI